MWRTRRTFQHSDELHVLGCKLNLLDDADVLLARGPGPKEIFRKRAPTVNKESPRPAPPGPPPPASTYFEAASSLACTGSDGSDRRWHRRGCRDVCRKFWASRRPVGSCTSQTSAVIVLEWGPRQAAVASTRCLQKHYTLTAFTIILPLLCCSSGTHFKTNSRQLFRAARTTDFWPMHAHRVCIDSLYGHGPSQSAFSAWAWLSGSHITTVTHQRL